METVRADIATPSPAIFKSLQYKLLAQAERRVYDHPIERPRFEFGGKKIAYFLLSIIMDIGASDRTKILRQRPHHMPARLAQGSFSRKRSIVFQNVLHQSARNPGRRRQVVGTILRFNPLRHKRVRCVLQSFALKEPILNHHPTTFRAARLSGRPRSPDVAGPIQAGTA
jgi:hypothetical protein